MSRKVNQDKLLAKIAALTGTDATELKEKAKVDNLYSFEEAVMQKQSVINFFRSRYLMEEPRLRPNETKVSFAKRQAEWQAAYNEWKIRKCEGCGLDFAYAYTYDGVSHCSLECLDTTLRKIGLSVTPNRDLKKRWGLHHPAIVPADALETLRQIYEPSSSSLDADAL